MNPGLVLAFLVGYTPIALLVFAPLCARIARRRNRDAETWLLLGGAFGPLALALVAALPARTRWNAAEQAEVTRRRTPASRIPTGRAIAGARCLLCDEAMREGHRCRPEVVEDRVQGRWTVRVGGQRILGPPF